MSFGNHDFIPIAAQHQQALLRYASEFRLVRRSNQHPAPTWGRQRPPRAPDAA